MRTEMHPAEDILLRYTDGETTARETRETRTHLEACWRCRAAVEEVQRTVGDCVRYRKAFQTITPEPPAPWADIYRKFEQADRELEPTSWLVRLRAALSVRLLAPIAAAVAVIAVFYYQHTNAPAVSAAELLRQAVAVSSRTTAPVKRSIQVRTRSKSFVLAAKRDVTVEALFRAANYESTDPLSAKAYAEWRDQLSAKTDDVVTLTDGYRIRTMPGAGEVSEASLRLSSSSANPDLRAVEATLRFKNNEFIEMRETAEVPQPLAAQPSISTPQSTIPLDAPGAAPLPDSAPAATPADELRVLAILHQLGADLGEPIEVARSGSKVLVSAAGLASDRQRQIRDAISSAPNVDFRVDLGSGATSTTASANTVTRRDTTLQLAIERQLGGRAQFERFAEQALETSDDMMTRAHALRRLAQRFPSVVEAGLAPQDRQTLAAIRHDHTAAFAAKAAALRRVMDPVLTAMGAPVTLNPASPVSPSWQAAADNAFSAARQTERLVAAVLGGSPGETVSDADFPSQTRALLNLLDHAAGALSRN